MKFLIWKCYTNNHVIRRYSLFPLKYYESRGIQVAIDETNKRMQIFSKFNKVINGDINQSTELMTAGINSLQVDAQELSDVLVKVGAVSGTSAQEVGAIIQKSGAMAKEGKISLQELATMGAIVSEKTRESGKVLPS
ncbi:hypothetical protein ADU76_04265 (plasmid) [Clostridium botulinum]|uniref:phage tail tape measure protein n=1 Tax=Clostridium botulinum TaxID=1491 RepID=UPI0004D5B736|nr:phage tail tape measure protein [Clostridium botulinum]KEH96550.1 conserved hypothetical phage-related protein [Clostridium botulinum D str. 16868]KOA94030.1 hypothetical protein ADU76_04265 [Clostridium botulinum]